MTTATLRTGDVKKYSRNRFFNDGRSDLSDTDANWAVVANNKAVQDEFDILAYATRQDARHCKWNPGERIARILKITPKFVTVEITK